MSSLLDAIQKTQIPDIFAIQKVLGSEQDAPELFRLANNAKQRVYGNKVFVRAVIEFSSDCYREEARYGVAGKVKKKRYRMEPDEIVEAVLEAAKYYKTVILQSGQDVRYSSMMLVDIVKRIREKSKVGLMMSVGERSPEAFDAMREAGADEFLITYETATELVNEKYPHASPEDCIKAQDELRQFGYEVGSGFLVGLPGQTDSTVAAEILTMYKQDVDIAGIGPFIAIPGTLVQGYPDGSPDVALRALAVTRILIPRCHLPATESLNIMGRMQDALTCGADAVLQTATPEKYRQINNQYPGDKQNLPLQEQRSKLDDTLRGLGLEPD